MQSEKEILTEAMSDFRGKIPSAENWLKSRLQGIWKNGYRNGYEQGVEVGKADVQNKLEVIDEIKQGEYNRGFEVGLSTAWDVARKLRHPSYSGVFQDERKEIFGYENADDVLTNLSAAEALLAVHEYGKRKAEKESGKPEKHDWKGGDCVYDISGNFCMITQVGAHIHVLYPNGKTHKWSKGTRFRKAADKHLDFSKILKLVVDAEKA